MKFFEKIILFCLLFITNLSLSQNWIDISSNLPVAAQGGARYEVQSTVDSSVYLSVAKFNSGNNAYDILTYRYVASAWNLISTFPTTVNSTYQYMASEVINNDVYFWVQSSASNNMTLLKASGNSVSLLNTNTFSFDLLKGIGLVSDPVTGELFAFYDNFSTYKIDKFNTGTNTFVSAISGSSFSTWTNYDVYFDNTNAYLSYEDGNSQFGIRYGSKFGTSLLNFYDPIIYNPATTLYNNISANKILGDFTGTTSLFANDVTNNFKDIMINPGYGNSYNYNSSSGDIDAVNSGGTSYILTYGGFTTLKVAKKNYGTNTISNYGPVIANNSALIDYHINKPDYGGKLVVNYKDNTLNQEKVFLLNNAPTINSNGNQVFLCSDVFSTTLFGNLSFEDLDGDSVYLINVLSSNNAIINPASVYAYNFQSANITYSDVYADIANVTTNTQVTLTFTYTDGFELLQFNKVYDIVPTQNLAFTQDLIFCNTSSEVDLFDYVNILGGKFEINESPISNLFDPSLFANDTTIYFDYLNYDLVCTNSAYDSIVILDAPIVTSSIVTDATGCATNDGSIDVTIDPGSSTAYDVQWSNNESSLFNSGLNPNLYFLEIIGDNGCVSKSSYDLSISGVSINATITDVNCFGGNDGTAIIDQVIGLSGPFTYFWDNGQSTNTATNLYAGNHYVMITDNNDCMISYSFTINEPLALSVNYTYNDANCGSSNGGIDIDVSGGTAPYTYQWSSGQTSQDISNITQGFYSVIVTDANMCSVVENITINDYPSIYLDANIVDPNCNQNNGSINVHTALLNGETSATYLWNTGQTTEDLTGVAAGTYNLQVLSDLGCYSNRIFVLNSKVPQATEICVITVDDTTTSNLLVWEKLPVSDINYYNIYRETDIFNQYIWIDSVAFDTLSTFNDVVASPIVNSWRYKISTVNFCDVESVKSFPHRTMHLTAQDLGGGQFKVRWNKYEGTSYANFELFRYTTASGWESILTLPSTVTEFIDMPTSTIGLDYKVEIALSSPCSATKAEDYNYVRSNREKGKFAPGFGTGNSSNNSVQSITEEGVEILMYPNPVQDLLMMELNGKQNGQIEIYDTYGRLIKSFDIAEGKNKIDCSELSSGIYSVKVVNFNYNGRLKFVKD